MNIKITADSTCDLSGALLQEWNISLMPMHILMGEESYLDGVSIRPADVFAHVQNGGKMPKSAAANLVEYADFFDPFAKEYDAVIHISVSSKLSSCYQNACLAAQQFENVSVVDSQNICTGQGYLVLQAAKWAADGLLPRNITMRLQNLAKRVQLSFVLNQLDYMAKSGRCSGVLAFGGGRGTESDEKVPWQPAHLRGQVHHRPAGRPGRHRHQHGVHLLLPAQARLHGGRESRPEKIRQI